MLPSPVKLKREKKMLPKQENDKGISLRTIHLWLIIGAVIVSGLMILFTFQLTASFHALTNVSEQQVELARAARELMDASDYLTEKVQRFTVQGEMQFLEEYFTEALESKRREEAIDKMSEGSGSEAALQRLQTAMDYSLELLMRQCIRQSKVENAHIGFIRSSSAENRIQFLHNKELPLELIAEDAEKPADPRKEKLERPSVLCQSDS